ncbi:sigma-E processing peptidase SpoIIGA [Alkalihalobacillus pseudalcaliphilus]|uniref:sigma-E processing peptidase SpoIIGA n=1 Tax=Alkalihalobacillus pseudalcaliphilus TaxID=79884 RepID=UPI00064DED15|nr:sigma-E processing peptidase SpoIIGA [Alkalihalobacillus pseudalcaliphilus]KMK77126.1 protease [Alkalihalobacillus pseudalcaliphilus]
MTIYLDLIWLLNLFIDYLLIALTAILLKSPFKHLRFIMASIVASFIVILMFTSLADIVHMPWFKLSYSALIVWIAFGYQRLRYFMRHLFGFYFVTFMTGGALFALHFFWQTEVDILSQFALPSGIYMGSTISWVFVLLGFPLVWYFAKQNFDMIETRKFQSEQIAMVRIILNGQKVEMKGLVDTGNQLVCPITKWPVLIVEARILRDVYGEEVIGQLLKIGESVEDLLPETEELMDRVRIIPYRAVGQGNPFLTALKPDQVEIICQNQLFETKKVLVGIQEGALSAEQHFRSIIHPKLVQGPVVEKVAQ